ncbi:hypothetical protein CANARDRAFT_28030 [[Candida] arabinofermentans NRRL YB-2248]|uniref:C2H2-type domain-containing protein n=1 Tax=[Candida] arabinofermentans NRRL YB-2248 TaxID=983967 RepID=A0A1E4T2L3_9ASCO|nr:hypothetical protein CANARDRAFT_28030 [[Candida] arabinofermentans NRRL YB-2248]
MSTVLEEERSLLEELEKIEYAVTKRIKRNASIYKPTTLSKDHNILEDGKKPLAQTLLQQHEIKKLIDKYQTQSSTLLTFLQNDKDEISQLKEENADSFKVFEKLYKETTANHQKTLLLGISKSEEDIYDMFSCNVEKDEANESQPLKKKQRKNRKRLLSAYTADLKLSKIFTEKESFGKFLDLQELYRAWLSLPRTISFDSNKVPTYLNYLDSITQFDDENLNKKTGDYIYYLNGLLSYLKNFWIKIQPLSIPERSITAIESNFESEKEKRIGSTATDGSIYCSICEKSFAKQTVFDSHLTGKKHKKNAQNNTKFEIMKLEYIIKELLNLLSKQLENTKNEAQRFKLLTTREKQLELKNISNISDYEYDYDDQDGTDPTESKNQDSNSDETIYNPLKLPLGPDGKPIPFWLWKLKGLDSEFNCEVCGNLKYKGKLIFSKHFKEPKHELGLKMLGIEDNFDAFKDISKIDDVLKLLEVMKTKKREQLLFNDMATEVEDDEGNVMTEKVYQQLKKQGLL